MNHEKLLLEYMSNLTTFAKRYLWERYKVDVKTNFYYPDFTPKSYVHLQEWDRTEWRDRYFGKNMQIYCCYGLDFVPHREELVKAGINPNMVGGYCEAKGQDDLQTDDMIYVEMTEYLGLAQSPYRWYEMFGKLFFHEIDHQILYLLKDPRFISGVHRAQNLPPVVWQEGKTDSFGNTVYFLTQQDPRLVM